MKDIIVRFKRKNSWPCSIEENTEDNEIEELTVKENETYLKDGVRYYDILCGHGCTIPIPIIQSNSETTPSKSNW